MEILFHRYGSICEPDIIDAFQTLGVNVIEEDSEIQNKRISGEVRIRLLAEKILTNKPAFVFSINYFPYISEVCQKLNVMYVCLSVDCPVLEFFSDSIHNSCNRIFLFDYNQYLQFKDENPECIFYLPLGTNVSRWDEALKDVKKDTGEQKDRWLYDVSLVGSLYNEKSPYDDLKMDDFDRGFADGLIEAQLKLPGLDLVYEVLDKRTIESIKNAKNAQDINPWQNYVMADAFTDTEQYIAANYYLAMRISEQERIRFLNMLECLQYQSMF